ncbi:uncharacterized protein LOC116581383 [Mustela erminea]|uniref:uncharacterized protein LOC116581383 n=1 Tax=Mustela erminea TaxID=36723 RepID=UPI001386C054|nr:uncharacterized protein LOC116581383 [Mustela erminea]
MPNCQRKGPGRSGQDPRVPSRPLHDRQLRHFPASANEQSLPFAARPLPSSHHTPERTKAAVRMGCPYHPSAEQSFSTVTNPRRRLRCQPQGLLKPVSLSPPPSVPRLQCPWRRLPPPVPGPHSKDRSGPPSSECSLGICKPPANDRAARTNDSRGLEWRTREGATPRSRRPELLQGTQQAKLPDSRGFPKGSHSSSIPFTEKPACGCQALSLVLRANIRPEGGRARNLAEKTKQLQKEEKCRTLNMQ